MSISPSKGRAAGAGHRPRRSARLLAQTKPLGVSWSVGAVRPSSPFHSKGGPGRNFIRRRTLRLAFGFLGPSTVLYKENPCKFNVDMFRVLGSILHIGEHASRARHIHLYFSQFPNPVSLRLLLPSFLRYVFPDFFPCSNQHPTRSCKSPTFADSFPAFAYY